MSAPICQEDHAHPGGICPIFGIAVGDTQVMVQPRSPEPAEPTSPPRGGVECAGCGRDVTGTTCSFCGTPVPTEAAISVTLPFGVALTLADGECLVLGREAPDARVAEQLATDTVSRQHTRLTRRGNTLLVEDLNSTNGTYIDDRLVGSQPIERTPPFRLGLGKSVTVEVA